MVGDLSKSLVLGPTVEADLSCERGAIIEHDLEFEVALDLVQSIRRVAHERSAAAGVNVRPDAEIEKPELDLPQKIARRKADSQSDRVGFHRTESRENPPEECGGRAAI